jgi:toxin ParE1/3/4
VIVVITDTAEQDFEHIGDYIAQFNPLRAESLVDELYDRCQRLSEMPLRYQLLSGHEESGLRRLPHGAYLVFYRVQELGIEIVRILNAAQDHEAILFPDETPDETE